MITHLISIAQQVTATGIRKRYEGMTYKYNNLQRRTSRSVFSVHTGTSHEKDAVAGIRVKSGRIVDHNRQSPSGFVS